jgi:ribosomal protein S27E
MALKRRIKKLSKSEVRKISGRHYLICGECGNEEVEVPSDVARVTCAHCVQKMVAPPTGYKKESTGTPKPRGWHFKMYFEQDGIVYSKGVEVTDPAEIKRLKKENTSDAVPKPSIKKVVKKVKVTKKTPKKTSVRGRKSARSSK